MRRVFAFTGIPGTGVQHAVERLAQASKDVRTICIDRYLWEAFTGEAQKKPELLKMTLLNDADIAAGSKPNWWNVLTLPHSVIRKYWRIAATRALEEIKNSKESLILLAFHAFYQSDDYRWRFSAVDPAVLREFEIKAFFALIDDIYDVHRRRKEDVQADVVDTSRKTKWDQAAEQIMLTIEYLEQIIVWRQEEILLTDLFAAAVGVPAHVFSVKHPTKTLCKLLEQPRFSYYLSHPITSIRGKANFVDTDEFREVFSVSNDLRRHTTLIEPTTIDEFRISSEEKNETLTLLPKLGGRWPLLSDPKNLLCGPIDDAGGYDNFSFAGAYVQQEGLNEECLALESGEGPRETADRVSLSLGRLAWRIGEDITWRDHHLVDQTKRLIVFRPTMKGSISSGVKREIEYYEKMALSEPFAFSCLIYHPEEDQIASARRVAELIVNDWGKHPDVGRSIRPRIDKMPSATKQNLLGSVAAAVTAVGTPESRGRSAVAALEAHLTPASHGPMPMSRGRTSEILQRKAEVTEIAINCAVKVIKIWHYIAVLEGRTDLGISVFNEQDQLFEAIQKVTNRSNGRHSHARSRTLRQDRRRS